MTARPPGFGPPRMAGDASLRVNMIGESELEVVVHMSSDGTRGLGIIKRQWSQQSSAMEQVALLLVTEDQASQIMTAFTVFGIRPYPTLANLE